MERVETAINELENNDFTLYFFVVDCNNTPNGEMYYIYQLAKTLKDKGYNVVMLYQLANEYTPNEIRSAQKKNQPLDPSRIFGGVGEWLGKEYADLTHQNVLNDQWAIKPSDFLFIPEALSSIMLQTYKLNAPCKRYVIQYNFDNVTEFIPLSVEWKHYGIYDVVTTSENQAALIKSVFPYVRATVIPPCIPPMFGPTEVGKKLIVNIVAKRQSDVNKIVKQFYWKYPMYKFVSFQDLRNYPLDGLASELQASPITVWVDDHTPFGYTALAAMRCGNLVIGKVPEVLPDWAVKEDGQLRNNCLWTYDVNAIPDIVAQAVSAFLQGNDDAFTSEDVVETCNGFTIESWNDNVEMFGRNIVKERIDDLKNAHAAMKTQLEKEEAEAEAEKVKSEVE